MDHILDTFAKETNGISYNTLKYSYDKIGVPSISYDDFDKVISWKERGETENLKSFKNLTDYANKIRSDRPILSFFLDGSRHVFKVDDMAYNRHVYPIIAGQIGVGCCGRRDKRMYPVKLRRDFVMAVPKDCNSDGWHDEEYLSTRLEKINNLPHLVSRKIKFSKLLPYGTSPGDGKEPVDFQNKGISVIQDYMIEAEKQMVLDLVKERLLNQDNYLVKDGSLEYSQLSSQKKSSYHDLQRIKNNYNYVIGISKSFNPESCKDISGKSNSNYIADLPLYSRTPVARYKNDKLGNVDFGVWYLRIRDKNHTSSPFSGIVKVEKILMENELEYGIDSELVDLLSANIINERNPTCYGKDARWANHIYPVFLTESFVKSQYMSSEAFLKLF